MPSVNFPATRLRRMRDSDFIRRLHRENAISVDDLIYPIFVCAGENVTESIPSMPGIFRYSMDRLLEHLAEVYRYRIPAVALFPSIAPDLKSADAKEAYNANGLVPSTIRAIKDKFPDLGVISDVALDPYTLSGQDGIIDEKGYVLNDVTVDILTQQALCHAAAGADIVAPSDMMDGRIAIIREALEESGYINTKILAYTAKYASALYGPFRDAVASKGALGKADKKTYQLDPANAQEALWEAETDISEGADMIMVKPGLPYLDVIQRLKQKYSFPTFAYNVSGEYAMVKAGAAQGWIDEQAVVLESMVCFKRAGADAILTYHALDIAKWLT